MSSVSDSFREDAAAYALGILEPAEARAFETHLADCLDCVLDVQSFQRAAGTLGQIVPPRLPSAAVRDRILASIHPTTERHSRSVTQPGTHPAIQPPSHPATRIAWLAMAASILLTIGVAGYAMRLQIRIAELETRLDQALSRSAMADRVMADARRVAFGAEASLAVVTAPDVARIDLAGQADAPTARGRALWSRARGLVFAASNLPPLPEGRVYQVWVVTAQAPISAGLLSTIDTTGATSAYFMTAADIPPPVAVAVTLEPAGGVTLPTGPRFLIGTPAGS